MDLRVDSEKAGAADYSRLGRTPVTASVDGLEWTTSVFRSKDGKGFLPVPKRVRGDKDEGARVMIAFSYEDD